MPRRKPVSFAKRARQWRAAAIVNAYRGLCLLLLGASPVLIRVALATPFRAAVFAGASVACWRNAAVLRLLLAKLPVPEVAKDAIASDCAHFTRLTAKGPIFRAAVRLLKRCVDCQRAPLCPSRVHASAVTSTSATLTWEPTVASWLSDESYRLEMVQLEPDGAEPAAGVWAELYDGPLCSHELRDLRSDTPYACRVRAHNGKGTSAVRLEHFVTRQLPTPAKGGVAPCYSWSQDTKEVVVRALVPAGTRAADVSVSCTATALRVALLRAGADGGERVLLAGTLAKLADPSEFAWQFAEPSGEDERERAHGAAGGRVLEMTIPKADGNLGRPLWRALIVAYPEPPSGAARPSTLALHLEHRRIDVGLIKEEVPELGDHHLKELAEMMKGRPIGRDDDDE